MSYHGMSIKNAINYITTGRMYLPAIQRKYVWDEKQIIKLFDSILKGYPIGTFLFWKLNKKIANENNYLLYQFIKDYHERDNFINPPAPLPFPINLESEDFFSVLDGQQRLTSMYLVLQGSLALKKLKARRTSDNAFIKKELYFNLESDFTKLSNTEDDEITYEFQFFSENEFIDKKWFKVKNILTFEDNFTLFKYLNSNDLANNNTATANLTNLWEKVSAEGTESVINYFEIDENDMNNVLNIFVRVNSGGTVLSKSDLLFSTIISFWDKGRDLIEQALEILNRKGQRFNFNNDFIMRTCLCLMDLPINLKVESFKKDSVLQIKQNWKKISSALNKTVDLLVEFGFCDENLVSYNAVIPVIYYIYNDGILNISTKFELKKYLIIALVKKLFGTASNSVISEVRSLIKSNVKKPFDLACLKDFKTTADKTFIINEDFIEELFEELQYGSYTFMVLSLLYPELKLGQINWHQDHLHPFTAFDTSKLSKLGVNNDTISEWQKKKNRLGNLQLLQSTENYSKNKEPLKDWLKNNNAKFVPENVSLELIDFDIFFEIRQSLMKQELKKILLGEIYHENKSH